MFFNHAQLGAARTGVQLQFVVAGGHRLAGEQAETGKDFTLLCRKFHLPQRGILGEHIAQALEEGGLALVVGFVGAALFAFVREALELALFSLHYIDEVKSVMTFLPPALIGLAFERPILQDSQIVEVDYSGDVGIIIGRLNAFGEDEIILFVASNSGLSTEEMESLAWVSHFGYGSLLGAVYGLFARKPLTPRLVLGRIERISRRPHLHNYSVHAIPFVHI